MTGVEINPNRAHIPRNNGGLPMVTWDNMDQKPRRTETGIASAVVNVPLAEFSAVDQNEVELYDIRNGGWAMAMQNGLFEGAVTYTITEYQKDRGMRVSTVFDQDIEYGKITYKAGTVLNQRYFS